MGTSLRSSVTSVNVKSVAAGRWLCVEEWIGSLSRSIVFEDSSLKQRNVPTLIPECDRGKNTVSHDCAALKLDICLLLVMAHHLPAWTHA